MHKAPGARAASRQFPFPLRKGPGQVVHISAVCVDLTEDTPTALRKASELQRPRAHPFPPARDHLEMAGFAVDEETLVDELWAAMFTEEVESD